MEIKTLKEAYMSLKSSDPKVRMNTSIMAIDHKFWFATPPDWFSINSFPDVLGFDSDQVIYGTNYKNLKIITWDQLKSNNINLEDSEEELDLLKNVA